MERGDNKFIIEPERRTPVVMEVDVAIVGGGPAGLIAALAAARNGVKTLLIERYGFLGGQFTLEHSSYPGTPTLGMGFQDTGGRQIVKGIGWEIIERLKQRGGAYGPVERTVLFGGEFLDFSQAKWGPKIDGEILKTLAFEMVEEAGVKLMLHSLAVDAISSNGSVGGVIVQNKSGRQAIQAKVVIDASADADVAAAAGAPYEKAGRDEMWAMNVDLKLGNVDTEKAARFIKQNPDKFAFVIFPTDEKVVPEGMQFPIFACVETKKGDLKVTENRQVIIAKYPQGTIFIGFQRGVSDATGGFGGDATEVGDLTQAEIVGRRRALKAMEWLRQNIPGFEYCFIISTVPLGTRESRRIVGEYTLTKEDIISGRKFYDTIGLNNMPLDMHLSDGGWEYRILKGPHDIPYRCIVPKKIENLLVAGRCISCDHIAQSSLRKITACMVTGQAAGVAAALAVKKGIRPRDIDYRELQKLLIDQGVELGK